MGKAPRTQTTTQTMTPDAWTQNARNTVWGAAQNAAGAVGSTSPYVDQAAGMYGQYAGLGQQGAAALGGSQRDILGFMNPYQQNVLDQVQNQYGVLANRMQNTVNDAATRAGAFGGTRHGVATGVALGELGRNAQEQIASLTSQGFEGAMGRASMAANLGLAGASGLFQAGQYADMNSPEMRRLGILSGTLASSPSGSTQTMAQPVNRNRAAGLLGGAATGMQLGGAFGPWGAGIGAGLGGLLGFFG